MATTDCPALPKGWKREEIIRKNGLSSGKIDVFYYSPSGKRFRSKPQLARFLGDAVDLSTFDYRSGKINSLLLRKSKRQRGTQFDYNRGIRNDASLVPPIRQTASIFKQPVTVIKSTDGKTRTDFKHGPQDKPKQLFWEKRLQGLRASDMDEEAFTNFELPKNMKGIGPDLSEETLLRSIATALHVSGQPIVGQTNSRVVMDKNPSVYINPEQPLVQAIVVTEEDIKKQEEKVQLARKKLQECLKELCV
ncbi:methyl-CpG-binding domain protein 2 [Nephila pilipes]|uniref:Methyl-CpG-binding domain protein 2 n=1 Tax=Nephila pilipes TaxID=299642 RepID=A0A8X6PPG0_NEPPI|nr:methyl-CpG-binding domain protein 2 [Nephila pilipes]